MPRTPKTNLAVDATPAATSGPLTWETLIEDFNPSQRDIVYRTVCRTLDGTRIRVTVRSNSYDFQSLAMAEVWSPLTAAWNEVDVLPYRANHVATLTAPMGSIPVGAMARFQAVSLILKNRASMILGV